MLSMNPNCKETAMSGIEPGTFGVLGERWPARQIRRRERELARERESKKERERE